MKHKFSILFQAILIFKRQPSHCFFHSKVCQIFLSTFEAIACSSNSVRITPSFWIWWASESLSVASLPIVLETRTVSIVLRTKVICFFNVVCNCKCCQKQHRKHCEYDCFCKFSCHCSDEISIFTISSRVYCLVAWETLKLEKLLIGFIQFFL